MMRCGPPIVNDRVWIESPTVTEWACVMNDLTLMELSEVCCRLRKGLYTRPTTYVYTSWERSNHHM